jgi:cytochrome c oxidase subunit II
MNILLYANPFSPFMPPQASTVAGEVDTLYGFIFWLSVVFFILVLGPAAYFVWKYRQRGDEVRPTPWITHNLPLELAWSVIPLILVVIIAIWGFWGFMSLNVVPANASEVQVIGYKWGWRFEHNGRKQLNELNVPVGRTVKLVMTSLEDAADNTPVIHSFFVPAFRVKQDIPPGRFTYLWFTPTEIGKHQVFCTEYCGDGHSAMLATVNVMSQADFDKWLKGDEPLPAGMTLAQYGGQLYTKNNCNTCHSIDGTKLVGPTFKGLFGASQPLTTGASVPVDENFLRESILQPQAKVAEGFAPVMPSYQGLLSDRDVQALVEYIKTVK